MTLHCEVNVNFCIFPGTFNPIHEAHLCIANYALQKFKFDKIIFIPAYIPPHKEIKKNIALHRFKMVQLATAYNPRFEVSDIEFNAEEKSYTLNTVKKIKEIYKINDKVNMIIGTDAFSNIKSWYKADELKEHVHYIVFPRGVDINVNDFKDYDYELTTMKYIPISSTELRNGKFRDKINNEVREYIKQNDLYEY